MPVSVNCEQCQAHYLIDDKFAGKRAKCKKCGHVMAIPLPGGPGAHAASPNEDTGGGGGGGVAGALAAEASPWGGRGGNAGAPPKGWRPEEVVVERDEDVTDIPIEQPLSYDAAYTPAIGPMIPALIGLFVVAVLGLAIREQVTLPEQSVAHSLPVWAGAVFRLATFFVIVGPMAMGGFMIASKIRGFRLARPTYARATAVAALPLTLMLVLGALASFGLDNEILFLLLVLVVVALTLQAVRAIFYLEIVSGLVATGCALVTGMIGFGISLWLMTLLLSFVPAPPERPQVVVRPPAGGGESGTDGALTEGEPGGDPTTQASPGGDAAANQLREASTARLSTIAAAIQRQFGRTQGAWPASLEELVTSGALTAEELRSPFAAEGAGPGYAYGASPSPYATAAEVVVAYDSAALQPEANANGTSVLFGDLNVRWLERADLDKAIARSQEVVAEAHAAMAARPNTPNVPGADPNATPGAPKTHTPVPANPGVPDAEAVAKARREAAEALATQVRDKLGPAARSVKAVPLPTGFAGVIGTHVPSEVFAVVSRPERDEERVEVWAGNPPARRGEALSFKVDPQGRPNYAVAPGGERFVRIGTFPRLSARVRQPGNPKDSAALDLDRNLGTPNLLGFLDPDRFLIRWERGSVHGLQLLSTKTGKGVRSVELPYHQATPANEAVSPDGRWFAHAVRAETTNQVVLHPLAGGRPRKLALTALDPQWPIQPAGIAFAPDSSRVAALFVHRGEGLVVVWNVARPAPAGKATSEFIVPSAVQAILAPGGRPAPSLDWVAGGRALLLCGTVVLDATTGELIAELGLSDVAAQSVGAGNVFRVATAKRDGAAGGMVVVELDPAALPGPEAGDGADAKPDGKAGKGAKGGKGTITRPRTTR